MTSRDTIPFGKFKGNTLGSLKRDQSNYVSWLCDQDWFREKNPDMYAFFTAKSADDEAVLAEPLEASNLDAEQQLLLSVGEPFRRWWARAYGERLRKDGAMLYIAHLRVAIEAWSACERTLAVVTTSNPPPINALKAQQTALKDNRDEKVAF